MVVTATVDRGPAMIYFGQEVGEPGAGAEGFSGEDGRTTMFDYWGVPEHQKWVNGGKYDGGALSDEQKQLRQFYGDVLTLASSNVAIANGDYFDLTSFNSQKNGLPAWVSTYVRVYEEEKLLIVTNFNKVAEKVKIELTDEAKAAMKLTNESAYIGRDLLRSGGEIGFSNYTTELELPPYSAFIYKIK
jgi:hypothetical protein